MATKKEKKGRLDKSSLEQALEEAFNDAPEDAVVHGHENKGGIDPSFAGKLHDKLEGEIQDHPERADDKAEPTGLRAPACTQVLSAKDLAALDDEEDDEGGHVTVENANHGFIDNIDSKLVTELNKKLSDEVAHEKEAKAAGPAASSSKSGTGPQGAPNGFTNNLNAALEKLGAAEEDPFSSDLSAALEKKLGGQSSGGDPFSSDLSAALEKKLGGQAEGSVDELDRRADFEAEEERLEEEEAARKISGLKAPKATVKLSADALSKLDDEDDDVMDSAMMVAESHGAITDVDKSLVDELQKKLGGSGGPVSKGNADEDDDERQCSGFRAPMNTVKLDPSMLPPDDEDEPERQRSHGNIDDIDGSFVAQLQRKLDSEAADDEVDSAPTGCRAPQPTQKLDRDMLAMLDDEDDIPDADQGLMGATAAALSKVANLADDDIPNDTREWGECHDMDLQQEASTGMRAPQPTQMITADMLAGLDDEDEEDLMAPPPRRGGSKEFDPSLAASLQSKLASAGTHADAEPALREGNPDEAITPDDDQGPVCSGLKAPQTTCKLSADQLALLDDDDEDLPADEPQKGGGNAPQTMQVSGRMDKGVNEPQLPPGPSQEELATLTAAAAALKDVPAAGPVPAQKPPTALTQDNGSATKVIQSMQGSDGWGQGKPPASSCKLRLAWLSKEEVRKENEQLRKEIKSLRAEIEMHRKEATLARKA